MASASTTTTTEKVTSDETTAAQEVMDILSFRTPEDILKHIVRENLISVLDSERGAAGALAVRVVSKEIHNLCGSLLLPSNYFFVQENNSNNEGQSESENDSDSDAEEESDSEPEEESDSEVEDDDRISMALLEQLQRSDNAFPAEPTMLRLFRHYSSKEDGLPRLEQLLSIKSYNDVLNQSKEHNREFWNLAARRQANLEKCDLFILLAEVGCDINMNNALKICLRYGDQTLEATKKLIEKGANLQWECGGPLFLVSDIGEDSLREPNDWIGNRVNHHVENEIRATPVDASLTIPYLVSKGCDVNEFCKMQVDDFRLSRSIKFEIEPILLIFVQFTPLHLAANSFWDCNVNAWKNYTALIKCGADDSIRFKHFEVVSQTRGQNGKFDYVLGDGRDGATAAQMFAGNIETLWQDRLSASIRRRNNIE